MSFSWRGNWWNFACQSKWKNLLQAFRSRWIRLLTRRVLNNYEQKYIWNELSEITWTSLLTIKRSEAEVLNLSNGRAAQSSFINSFNKSKFLWIFFSRMTKNANLLFYSICSHLLNGLLHKVKENCINFLKWEKWEIWFIENIESC